MPEHPVVCQHDDTLEARLTIRENRQMLSITVRTLAYGEVVRVAEIDRTEQIRTGYRVEDGRLHRMDVVWDADPWRLTGDGHSIPSMIGYLNEIVSQGGSLAGAFHDDRLVGIAAFRPLLTPAMGQLAFLHISNGYRRQGIGARLVDQVIVWARQSGARQLYVSATPSGSAVDFYRSRGFEWTSMPHPELFEREPEDIHMVLEL